MSTYQLTWITDHLAVGHAPMSYADLDAIRARGVDAIVNLCGEYCDLHEIEERSGFEVYYLPIPDESTPDMADMEKALAWLDEAIYLGKKILVHCRFGVGRTGTFVTSYLIRKGMGLNMAQKKLKKTRANPSSYRQWRLLKKFSKKSGELKIRAPSLESRQVVDLSAYFNDYEALVEHVETRIDGAPRRPPRCGLETDKCCCRYFDLQLIEAIYLNNRINRLIKSEVRTEMIQRAVDHSRQIRQIQNQLIQRNLSADEARKRLREDYGQLNCRCPLNLKRRCLLNDHRPISCRLHNVPAGRYDGKLIDETLQQLSRNVFFAFAGFFMDDDQLTFSMADTFSGRFVQQYFYFLAALQNKAHGALIA